MIMTTLIAPVSVLDYPENDDVYTKASNYRLPHLIKDQSKQAAALPC